MWLDWNVAVQTKFVRFRTQAVMGEDIAAWRESPFGRLLGSVRGLAPDADHKDGLAVAVRGREFMGTNMLYNPPRRSRWRYSCSS
jgi:hypothetical protein